MLSIILSIVSMLLVTIIIDRVVLSPTSTVRRWLMKRIINKQIDKRMNQYVSKIQSSVLLRELFSDKYEDASIYANMSPKEFCQEQLNNILKHKDHWLEDILLYNSLLLPAIHHLYNKLYDQKDVLLYKLHFPIKNVNGENCIRLSMNYTAYNEVHIDVPVSDYSSVLNHLYIQLTAVLVKLDVNRDIEKYILDHNRKYNKLHTELYDIFQCYWRSAELSHIRDKMMQCTYCNYIPSAPGSITTRIEQCDNAQALWLSRVLKNIIDTANVDTCKIEPIVIASDSVTNEFIHGMLDNIQVDDGNMNHILIDAQSFEFKRINLTDALHDILLFQDNLRQGLF